MTADMEGILVQYIDVPDPQLPHTIARMFDDGQATLLDLVCSRVDDETALHALQLDDLHCNAPWTRIYAQIKAAEKPLTSTIDAHRKAVTDLLAKVCCLCFLLS